MLQLFIASFCDQTDIEGNGSNMTNAKKLKQQALLKLKKGWPALLETNNSIISFGKVDSEAITFLIFYPLFENSTTRIAIL